MNKTHPFFLLIIPITILLHFNSIYKIPTGAYAWAQADHYALSLGFLDNHFDFFHPKTYSLNHQYTPDNKLNNPQGITSVDFPILHYTVAIFYKLLNSDSPWIYRIISLVWSLIAIFFLYNALFDIKNRNIALIVCSFLLLQPCYAFYQDGFHVCSTAFNTFLIGLSFLLKHYYKNYNTRNFYLGILFLSLAALMRFTQIIPLIAIAGILLLGILNNKKFDGKIISVLIGITIAIGYFLYNKYLAKIYGSVFMNTPPPSPTLKESFYYVLQIIKIYGRVVLPPPHFAFVLVLAFLYWKQNKTRFDINPFLKWIFITFTGSLLFTIIMLQNVSIHDYYSIDVWLPVIIMTVIYFSLKIDFSLIRKSYIQYLGGLIIISALFLAIRSQHNKYNTQITNKLNGGEDEIINAFYSSKEFLDKHIGRDKKVLVICESGWNVPLIGWKRDAFRIAGNNFRGYSKIINEEYDYIITYNKTFKDKVLKRDPKFIDNHTHLNNNDYITIWE